MTPVLMAPHTGLCASFAEALDEGLEVGAHGAGDPAAAAATIRADPAGFVTRLHGPKPAFIELPDGGFAERAPETVFWWSDGAKVIGELRLRHRLTALLQRAGGHIGYGVRPSCSRQGHATAMLAAVLPIARERLALQSVAVHVREHNLASIRVVEKNGGVLVDICPYPYGSGMYRRYRVPCPA